MSNRDKCTRSSGPSAARFSISEPKSKKAQLEAAVATTTTTIKYHATSDSRGQRHRAVTHVASCPDLTNLLGAQDNDEEAEVDMMFGAMSDTEAARHFEQQIPEPPTAEEEERTTVHIFSNFLFGDLF